MFLLLFQEVNKMFLNLKEREKLLIIFALMEQAFC
jgi:hypothetical protein